MRNQRRPNENPQIRLPYFIKMVRKNDEIKLFKFFEDDGFIWVKENGNIAYPTPLFENPHKRELTQYLPISCKFMEEITEEVYESLLKERI